MANSGMDPAAVERIARQIRTEASNIGSLINRIAASVSKADANWQGADKRRFVDAWNGVHKRSLQAIKTALERLASTAASEAAQQRRISK
ncbi:MAG: WXG100 family type VII secretion target [Propionibacteriaceae bacterium]|jgi:WXG100 family type VII secretion target|nr:WXG100 family type VII secretion target [Propionibacteriaceae bacterium]